jgi:hypothetical protein
VRSVKAECLSKPILFGEAFLKRTLAEFVDHFHAERSHQGKGNLLLFPAQPLKQTVDAQILCGERLGGCFDITVAQHDFVGLVQMLSTGKLLGFPMPTVTKYWAL